jgi:cell division septation protein DedD
LVYTDRAVENRTKERLTGALILVALLVVLVPELLSGRAPRHGGDAVPEARPATEGPPLRTYTMDLAAPADATSAGQSALNVKPADAAVALPAPAPAPEPIPAPEPAPASLPSTAATAAAPAGETTPKPAPAAKPEPAPRPAAAPNRSAAQTSAADKPAPASGKGWFVQVGSFAKRENAQRYVQQLGKQGYAAQVLGGGALYRVRVGPVADRAAAVALQSRLAGDGFKGSIAVP